MKQYNSIPMSPEIKILSENGVFFKTEQQQVDAIVKSMHDWSENDWIKVDDKKPEAAKPIMLYNGHWIGVGYYKKNIELGIDYEPDWSDETGEYIYDEPTHWKLLPEPPNSNNIPEKISIPTTEWNRIKELWKNDVAVTDLFNQLENYKL